MSHPSGNIMAIISKVSHQIYGSSRLGEYRGGRKAGQLTTGLKSYELSNHLGNVLATVSDAKTAVEESGSFSHFAPEVVSATDYPFGLAMEGRTSSSEGYRWGFNGVEGDDAMFSDGFVFKYRIHNAKIGRFLSVDPLAAEYPWNSTYAFAENVVIGGRDLEGGELEWMAFTRYNVKAQIQNERGAQSANEFDRGYSQAHTIGTLSSLLVLDGMAGFPVTRTTYSYAYRFASKPGFTGAAINSASQIFTHSGTYLLGGGNREHSLLYHTVENFDLTGPICAWYGGYFFSIPADAILDINIKDGFAYPFYGKEFTKVGFDAGMSYLTGAYFKGSTSNLLSNSTFGVPSEFMKDALGYFYYGNHDYYEVKQGDSAWAIAEKFGLRTSEGDVDWKRLIRNNYLKFEEKDFIYDNEGNWVDIIVSEGMDLIVPKPEDKN